MAGQPNAFHDNDARGRVGGTWGLGLRLRPGFKASFPDGEYTVGTAVCAIEDVEAVHVRECGGRARLLSTSPSVVVANPHRTMTDATRTEHVARGVYTRDRW